MGGPLPETQALLAPESQVDDALPECVKLAVRVPADHSTGRPQRSFADAVGEDWWRYANMSKAALYYALGVQRWDWVSWFAALLVGLLLFGGGMAVGMYATELILHLVSSNSQRPLNLRVIWLA